MKSNYTDQLELGQSVKDIFILSRRNLKEKKDGSHFAVFEFTDRGGTIEGILWDNAEETIKYFKNGDFVLVSGTVNEYNGKLQIVVSTISPVNEQEIDSVDFIPTSEENIKEVIQEIREFIKGISNKYLKELLVLFFHDDAFIKQFSRAPAAKRAHHAYLGGLAVHTRNMARLASKFSEVYTLCDYDLLMAGVLLHDIGKIHEYDYQKRIGITVKGHMLGHIIIGNDMIADKIAQIEKFPNDLKLKLLHMIISHHGEFEWGSPKLPLFAEALLLHFIDNLDAKLEMILYELRRNTNRERIWSDFHPLLEREIYLGE